MSFELIKLSSPGWVKQFNTKDEVKAELLEYICEGCLAGGVDENSSIGELLWTACGCEFDVETNVKD